MSKVTRQYIDKDCLTAAIERVNHIIDVFDDIWIAFSGGKDSLAVLELVDQVYKQRGIKKKLNVFFRDEEVIYDPIIDFVKAHAESGRWNFRYLCIQLKSEKYILGKKYSYIQWDKNREHLRKMPEYSITDDKIYDQYSSDEMCIGWQGIGKICIITGVRASESMTRLRSILNKKNESYLTDKYHKSIMLARPIYDWNEKDVFKFFYDNDIKYCPSYDAQVFNGDNLRVSTPLHSEASKRLDKVKTLYPVFYDQMLNIFPEMRVQSEYYSQLDRYGIIYQYDHSWNGILTYIEENIEDPAMKSAARTRVYECMKHRKSALKSADHSKFGGYPILYVFKQIVNGNYKRVIMPKKTPTKQEEAYES